MKPIYFLVILGLLSACAHIVPPDGGRKDVTPPKFIKSTPEPSSLNIKPSKLVLTFDEYVQVLKPSENLSITPDLNVFLNPSSHKTKVYLNIPKDSLLPNTTYTINFGKGIADLNESNVLENYSFSFSTGNYLDTLSIFGTIVQVKENKPIENALIVLKKQENGLKYSTKSRAAGTWQMLNLSEGNYDILVFIDKDLNKTLSQNELYYKKSLLIKENPSPEIFQLIPYQKYDSGQLKVRSVNYVNEQMLSVKFNQSVPNINNIKYSVSSDFNKKDPPMVSTSLKDSFLLYHPFIENDTLALKILTDTLQSFIIKQGKTNKKKKQNISTRILKVRKGDPIRIHSNIPIKTINPEKIKINEDSLSFKILKSSLYTIDFEVETNEDLQFIFHPGAIIDINDDENLGDTLSKISIAKSEETGNFQFMVKDSLSKYNGPILVKIFDDNHEYIINTTFNKSNELKGLLPGNYDMEIFLDENKNGIWDIGNYEKDIQPEKIMIFNKNVIIKANWDTLGVEIYMN